MTSRGHLPSAYEGRSVQAPGMMRHGPYPGSGQAIPRPMDPFLRPELLENKMAVQGEEIERLSGDNHRLAATHVALRQDLGATQQDIQRLKAHIRSIQTESDIQIRVLLDKIAKMEVDIRAGESVRKDLQNAHAEAQSLVTARQVLIAEIQLANRELEKTQADVKKLPEMRSELDSLRKEHQRLRNTFEYEKGLNVEKVEQMQAMERDLVGMAREVEKLRAEVLNAEKRAHVPNPYGGPYMNQDPSYPPPMHGNAVYVDGYGRPVQLAAGERMIVRDSGVATAASGGVGVAVPPGAGANAVWAYETSLGPR